MALAGLYRRILPSPPAIDFASSEGKKLFIEAIHDGNMEGFFKLISYFQTQSEPAYCGLATLSMVLNALAIDPGRKWKGPWRWFDESMLDCCEPLEKVKDKGISFGKVVCLAHCAGARVEAFRTNQSSIDEFRRYILSCSSSDHCHVIASYHRGNLMQTGTGHFSPIGGYHAETDMALILDVARFKYPPHWVPLSLLWEAMSTIDESTGQQRGFMLISKNRRGPALLYTLSCRDESWISTAKYLMDDVPVLLSSGNVKDVKDIISTIFASLPSDFSNIIKRVVEVRRPEDGVEGLSEEEKGRINIKEKIVKQVQETCLFKYVSECYPVKQTFPGAGILMGKSGSSDKLCCRDTCVRCYSAATSNGSTNIGVVDLLSTDAESSNFESGSGVNQHSPDVLTALLLALPPQTWSRITDKEVLDDVSMLFSLENLPVLLQEEILHLRSQLLMLKKCKENKIEDDLSAPLL